VAVVLITGCSSGIGLEAALAFAARGDTAVASMRNPAKAGTLRERAAAEGLTVDLVTLDVTDDASVTAAVVEVEQRHGPIDVLVNNAGVGYAGPVETIDLERARALVETNFWGPVRTMRAVLPSMRERGSGVIVNVSSVAGRVPGTPYQGFYGASKHALGALTEAMVMELEPFGVRFVLIEPGFFATSIMENGDGTTVPAGPYATDQRWITDFYEKSLEDAGGDPAVVGDRIVTAAHDPESPLHQLVGDDAVMFVDLVAQAGTVEAWIPMGESIAASLAGPRPVASKLR
jgi:NAD(P)-dependent dehydrogenase (short-subunit alcohol dehydrogenase family)